MAPLPVRALSGIGESAEKKLHELGIETLGDLASSEDDMIIGVFGKAGRVMLDRARCVEHAPIEPDDEVKSVSNETSFAKDLTSRDDIEAAIATMAAKVGRRLRRKGLAGRTLSLKVRYADFTTRSTQRPLDKPSDDEFVFKDMLFDMLDDLWQPGMALRLVGVAVTGFEQDSACEQLSLFPEPRSGSDVAARRDLQKATDKVKERFGESALRYGRELRMSGTDTGTTSKNPADYK